MNNTRRKQLRNIISVLEEAKESLKFLKDEEEEYLESIPENLHSSERYEKSELAVSLLDVAFDSFESAIESIEEAIE